MPEAIIQRGPNRLVPNDFRLGTSIQIGSILVGVVELKCQIAKILTLWVGEVSLN